MLPDPSSLRQVEGQKGPPRESPREAVDRTHPRQSQRDARVEEDRENLGIEDADPRWSKRELVLKRLDVPPPPPVLPGLGPDATDFRGQPRDPFEVLIKRREARREKARRGPRELAVNLNTGIGPLDDVLEGLEGRLYAICGPVEPGRALAHQIACNVAREHPVVYVSYGLSARELTLRALARLAGDRPPGDLARAREVADAFRPIRENLTVVEGSEEESVPRLRARMQQVLARRAGRHGAIVLDDLRALARVPAPPEPRPWQKARMPSQEGSRASASWVPGNAGATGPGRLDPGSREGQGAGPLGDQASGQESAGRSTRNSGQPGEAAETTRTVPAAPGPGRSSGAAAASAPAPMLEPEILTCARSLATVADQIGVPVIALVPAGFGEQAGYSWPSDLPEPVRLVIAEPPKGGSPVEIVVHRPQVRTLRRRGKPSGPPVVKLIYQPLRTAFEAPPQDPAGSRTD